MPVFNKLVPETTTKYKILWFVVDMHHRERYFFICDLNQIVTITDVTSRRRAAMTRQFAVFFEPPDFPTLTCELQDLTQATFSRLRHDFSPIICQLRGFQ